MPNFTSLLCRGVWLGGQAYAQHTRELVQHLRIGNGSAALILLHHLLLLIDLLRQLRLRQLLGHAGLLDLLGKVGGHSLVCKGVQNRVIG